MKRKMNGQKFIIRIMVLSVLVCNICGCGMNSHRTETDAAPANEIELLEPVGGTAYYDVAQYRDIYQANVFSGICVPDITEFAYTTEYPFDKYGKLPGETVTKGDVLIYGDTGSLDEARYDLTDEINEKIRDYEDAVNDLQEDIYDARQVEKEAEKPYREHKEEMPEEGSPFYDMWAMMCMPLEGAYRNAVMAREQLQQALTEKKELFALELEYDQGRLERMAEEAGEAQILSNKEGEVVAINTYMSGDYIAKNTNVIGIGDMQTKVVHTEYISNTILDKAVDIYASANGNRYEVSYVPMEKGEYTSRKKQNDVVYSQFYISDPNQEIAMGMTVNVIVIEDARENVLAVASDSLRRNGSDYYCYLFDGTETVVQPVSVGISDGMYTEVLAGISEGDRILMDNETSSKGESVSLEKGSVEGEYAGYGMLYYPSTQWIINPAKYGTCYIQEICVEKYEQVTQGQALIKIEVIPDSVSVARLERKIARQQERLNKLLAEKSKIYHNEIDRELDRAIESRQKAIENYTGELEKLSQYSGVVTLTAPYDGILTNLTEYKAGDMISYKENMVQIANQSGCYIIADDKEGLLSYGNEVIITYKGENDSKKEIRGSVVSVYGVALSKPLKTGKAIIRISEEDIAQITKYGSAVGTDGGWSRNQFEVRGVIHMADNVVLIPKKAVILRGKNTFVKVKEENGDVYYVPFIAGGSNEKYYWAVDGLSEGMKICLE